ncbi:MAG TPA: DUF5995 family protein [Myxococcota bacterium]|nr:DUF5995 family protein [Myxococcota bacterium]
MKGWMWIGVVGVSVLGLGCAEEPSLDSGLDVESWELQDGESSDADLSGVLDGDDEEDVEEHDAGDEQDTGVPLCVGDRISAQAAEEMILLTEVTDQEDIYTTYERIDGIASLFEACGDPWGMFPTSYRHITRRGIRAIEHGEFEDEAWARRIIVDFAGRYLLNLRGALTEDSPSWAWEHYYRLADRSDVSRTRAVVVGMVAHLTLDLPYGLVAVETTEANKQDFFAFGEMMIEVAPDFIEDLRVHYDTDAEDLLTGFFFGDWVDGAYGEDTMITLSYQTIRTKSWNNRWFLEQWWGGWIAEGEIYSAFWAVDGVLATLDAAGTI